VSGSQQQSENKSTQSTPWGPQLAELQTAFGGANGALTQAQASGSADTPSGFVAGMTPDQLSTFHSMVGYGNGSNTASTEAGAGATLAGAGTNATQGALSTLGGFDPTKLNNTGSITSAAGAYADNPYISGQVSAAMRDANQEAQDITLPGIQRDAAGTGNINSNRTAIANGIVQRGLTQQAGDISANLRGQAYGEGLSTAEGQAQSNNQGILSAATGQGELGGSAAATGIGGLSSSVADQGHLYDIAGAGGAGEQGANQATFDNQNAKYSFDQQAPFTPLQNFMSIIGSNNWGSNSNSQGTSTTTPSAWQVIGGLMNAGGSLIKSDRRVKTDIQQIGRLDNGLPVYSFRYTDDPSFTTMIGLMAQDVELVHPEAVRTLNGVKHVNYAKAVEPF
jgi:hypothetical protein